MGAHTGAAPKIRKLSLKYPELGSTDIAQMVGCGETTVRTVLATFRRDTSEEALREFQESKADVYDAIQLRILASLSPEKIEKAKLLESVTAAAILQDKSQVLRGQPSTINMNVLADVLELMRAKRDQRPIGERSATSSLDL